jgi:hypothetical protein
MSKVLIIPIPQIDDGIRLVALTADDADAIREDAAAIDGVQPLGAIDAWPSEDGWYWEWAILPRTGAARAELLDAIEELQEQG